MKRFQRALSELQQSVHRSTVEATASMRRVKRLHDQGRLAEAQELDQSAQAKFSIQYAQAGATFERTAISFLGEPKGLGETLATYAARVATIASSEDSLRMVQANNGILLRYDAAAAL
ncbi:MAG: hypothetical protein EOO15_03955 [Chitinophagaceae bacterium]|nr:MAG: hypothetical protein EOO15_03955 [Chitinophagaceae bacterium]